LPQQGTALAYEATEKAEWRTLQGNTRHNRCEQRNATVTMSAMIGIENQDTVASAYHPRLSPDIAGFSNP
jgi:hypothetical protein